MIFASTLSNSEIDNPNLSGEKAYIRLGVKRLDSFASCHLLTSSN
jgi:hypothetical protein